MQRFFCVFPLSVDMLITDVALVHQISHVLRARVGEKIILFSGDGVENIYEIVNIEKRAISLRGIGQAKNHNDPVLHIHLFQALPNKYEKIEYIIEKGVEVGITSFTFFRSEFSQRLSITSQKKARFLSIAREALEQCGGSLFPALHFIDTFDLTGKPPFPCIVLDTNVQKLNHTLPFSYEMGIFVWPEWWWSENELEKMYKSGSIGVHFSGRILRTETASSVVAFSLLHAQEFQNIII